MRIAGVWLPDGSARWVDAGELDVRALDDARVRIDGREERGTVFIAPEQLLTEPEGVDGALLSSATVPQPEVGCLDLPNANLPPLGSDVHTAAGSGRVRAVDPVARRVTLAVEGGEELDLPWEGGDDGP